VMWCLTPANRGQWAITCAAVSLAQPHEQAEDSIPGTHTMFRNAARPILPVLICVITALSALQSAVWRLTAARSGSLSPRSPHLGLSASHRHFHLLSHILAAAGPLGNALLPLCLPDCGGCQTAAPKANAGLTTAL